MILAPILVFCYNRINHLQSVINSLLANEEASQSDLIIYSDGPKEQKNIDAVRTVREYIGSLSGFKSVKVIEQAKNLGLANSVILGVTEVVNQYGKVIVVEDDMQVAPYFLRFMNDGLNKYQDDSNVGCICGYLYPVKETVPDAFFIYGADCGAWATWKDQWALFEPDGQKIMDDLIAKKLSWKFDFDGSFPYTRMLEDQIAARNNSWAIRWYGSAFLKNKLTLYPGKSLAQDIGFDNSGTHCSNDNSHDVDLYLGPIEIKNIPVEQSKQGHHAFKKFFFTLKKWTGFKFIRKRFKQRLRYLLTNKIT